MAVVYSTTLKSNRMQLVNDLVAGKVQATSAGTAVAGKLVIGDSTLSGATGVLATIPLPTTPFSLTAGPPTKLDLITGGGLTGTASASGTAAKAEFRTSADVTVVSGLTVGTSGTDIVLGSATIASGNAVTITAGTITHG
jgi:hypothetical protein